jgi:hypothetical protein
VVGSSRQEPEARAVEVRVQVVEAALVVVGRATQAAEPVAEARSIPAEARVAVLRWTEALTLVRAVAWATEIH